MNKMLFFLIFLLIALFLLPGGMASWKDILSIDGSVSVEYKEEVSGAEDEESETLTDLFADDENDGGEDPEGENSGNVAAAASESPATPIEYKLVISIEGSGTTIPTEGEHIYSADNEIELEAIPADGWEFNRWIINEEEIISSSSITVTLNDNTNIKAIFAENLYSDDKEEIGPEDSEDKEVSDSQDGETGGAGQDSN